MPQASSRRAPSTGQRLLYKVQIEGGTAEFFFELGERRFPHDIVEWNGFWQVNPSWWDVESVLESSAGSS